MRMIGDQIQNGATTVWSSMVIYIFVCIVYVDLLQSALVEAMRNGLDKLVGTSSGYLESLPASVRARIGYLEDVQNDYDAAEEALNEEIKGLERKYKPVFDKLLLLRKNVISGEEPVPDAFSVVADDIQDDDDDDDDDEKEEEDVVGIPDFWLVALCNHPMFDDMVGCSLFFFFVVCTAREYSYYTYYMQ
jgi:hypothetical protein